VPQRRGHALGVPTAATKEEGLQISLWVIPLIVQNMWVIANKSGTEVKMNLGG